MTRRDLVKVTTKLSDRKYRASASCPVAGMPYANRMAWSANVTRLDDALRRASVTGEGEIMKTRAALLLAVAGIGAVEARDASAATCVRHWDCPQEQFCYYGTCTIMDFPIYHCDKPGCPPGMECITQAGLKERCDEDPDYVCQNACDCGVATACLDVPGVGKTCVIDEDDPLLPGTSIFDVAVPAGEPTYCCSEVSCDRGWYAYSSGGNGFQCFDAAAGLARNYCTGSVCYSALDCSPGDYCVDTRPGSTAEPGASCAAEGGFCKSGAVAEVIYGWSSSDFLAGCTGALPGMTCEVGWRPGGAYAVQRVLATAGSCGNGACQRWETALTCAADCSCGDGVCDSTEVGACATDCGICGDGACWGHETPKSCAADCTVTCGDGSCDASEVTSCTQDCGCPASATYDDTPIWCGDGLCQPQGDIPENCVNCPKDCGAAVDADGDDIADCIDPCPGDAANDPDSDGLCAASDNCPLASNPAQEDFDADGAGDACDADDDDDGTWDADDECEQTPAGAVTAPDGCSVTQTCPCAILWRSHGAYVACVAHAAGELQDLGLLDAAAKDALVRSAAESGCGR